jgi:hypothetical protein
MSSGDITSLTIQGKFKLPGGGFKQDGTPTQHKTVVWGTVVCTTADTGIAINSYLSGGIKMFGLEELDVINFVTKAADGDAVGAEALYFYALERGDTPKIHHLKNVGNDNSTYIDAGDNVTLNFFAIGTALVA